MKLKNILLTLVIIVLVAGALSSCKPESKELGETIKIEAFNGSKELVEIEVPLNPSRVAILDMAALDIIDTIGEGNRVVGSATTTIEYLESYSPDKNSGIANLGTIKQADLEAVVECEPDIIFIGGRLAASYDELNKIAPTVYLAVDVTDGGLIEGTKENALKIASIFEKEAQIESLVNGYMASIEEIKAVSNGKTALVSMVSGTSASVLTNSGRCSLIGQEAGFSNIGNEAADSTHGDAVSFEFFVKKNPDYIFVMDRNSVTGDATTAKSVIENEIVKTTDAYKNGNIIYLENSNVWYTAEGGIKALQTMISDLKNGLGL